MFWNYLKVAYRNLLRHPLYAAINVVGLGIAISFCLLAFLFVRYEWTYDGFHENADRIYRIVRELKVNDAVYLSERTEITLASKLSEAQPDVQCVRLDPGARVIGRAGQTSRADFLYADPSILDVFSFPLIKGSPATALAHPDYVVITETMAEKYFPGENPIGKTISVQDIEAAVYTVGASGVNVISIGRQSQLHESKDEFSDARPTQEMTVTGVIRDIPRNSTIRFDFLSSLNPDKQEHGLNVSAVNTYIMLPDYLSPPEVERRIEDLQVPETRRRYLSKLMLQPLREIYFDKRRMGTRPDGNPVHSRLLGGIALLVLVVAGVNYTNLSVGRSFSRAREVGMRKVAGGLRTQLARQFLAESVLLTLIAFALGLALAELFMPGFNNLVSRKFALSNLADSNSLAFLFVMALVVGIFAGGYPALFMSRFFPVDALKGRFKVDRVGTFSRALLVFQLAISTALVTAMTIASIQMSAWKSMPLGFKPSHVVVIRLLGISDRLELAKVFEEAVRPHHSVLKSTRTSHGLNNSMRNNTKISWKGTTLVGVERIFCDSRFLDTMGIRLKDGRDFKRNSDAETSVIVNETLAKKMELETPLGETIRLDREELTVIGVVRDFHFRSLHQTIGPAVLKLLAPASSTGPPADFRYLLMIRIRPENVFDTLDFLREKWAEIVPDVPFDHNFLDEEIDRQYREEQRWFRIAGYATLFAVFIACLGAFGLTSLTVARRTKEIGIRKTLGAPTYGIISLLTREYVVLIGIAALISSPATYFAAERWLQDFAYRVDPGIGTHTLGGLLMLLMVLLAVSLQVTRAARANPVDALRYE